MVNLKNLKNGRNIKTFLILKFFFFFLFFVSVSAFAKIAGDIKLLKYTSENCATDLQHLKTWTGNAKIKCSVIKEMPNSSETKTTLKKEWEDEVEFVIDRSVNCIRWNRNTLEGFVEEQNEVTKIDPISSGGITNGEYDYIMIPYQKGNERSPRSIHIENKQFTERNILSDIFDPLYILENELGYSKLPEKLRLYFEKAGTIKNTEGSIECNGNIITFQIISKAEENSRLGDITLRYIFDISKGCNLTEFSNETSNNKRYWSLDYERVDNIFVPKKILMVYENKRSKSKMISKREVILVNNAVNQLVKPEEFEIEKVGLRSGDYILITGNAKEIKYQWLTGTATNQIITSKAELLEKVKTEAASRKIEKCPLPEKTIEN